MSLNNRQRSASKTLLISEGEQPQTVANQFIRNIFPNNTTAKSSTNGMEYYFPSQWISVKNHLQNICISYFIFRPPNSPTNLSTHRDNFLLHNIEPKPPPVPGPLPTSPLPVFRKQMIDKQPGCEVKTKLLYNPPGLIINFSEHGPS